MTRLPRRNPGQGLYLFSIGHREMPFLLRRYSRIAIRARQKNLQSPPQSETPPKNEVFSTTVQIPTAKRRQTRASSRQSTLTRVCIFLFSTGFLGMLSLWFGNIAAQHMQAMFPNQ